MINAPTQQPKKQLGKGLSALLNKNTTLNPIADFETSKDGAIEIMVNDIEPNPYQPRKEFLEEELGELIDSIVTYGVIQPIIVRKHNNKFQIIAGERRWQASKKLGLATIPAVIKVVSDKDTFEIALIENIQRQNLNAIEEAEAYEKMIVEYAYSHEALAKKIGKSRSHISNLIRLLALPVGVKSLIANQKISAGHARALIGLPNSEEMANRIVAEGWSVRRTEHEIKKLQNPHMPNYQLHDTSATPTKDLVADNEDMQTKDSDLIEIEEMLSNSIKLPVKIFDTPNGGKVVIEFTCLEDLDFIIQKLSADTLNF